jgi:uridine kinase
MQTAEGDTVGAERIATLRHTRVLDLATDELVRDWTAAPGEAVFLFAATFIQRDTLRQHWDEVIYLDGRLDRAGTRHRA